LRRENQLFKYTLPCVFADRNNIVIVKPDLNRTIDSDFKVISWTGGNANFAVVSHNDLNLSIPVAFTPDFLEDAQQDFDGCIEGNATETLNPIWLRSRPLVELPLRSLPVGRLLSITNDKAGKSKQYNTPLYNLKDIYEQEYYNIISNAELRNLVATGCNKFVINSITQLEQENTNLQTGKKKTRTVTKVCLEPYDSKDLSDI